MNEIIALQNMANLAGLIIHEKISEDKRKTVKIFFATKNGCSVSPVLDYECLNYFLLGWVNSIKNKNE